MTALLEYILLNKLLKIRGLMFLLQIVFWETSVIAINSLLATHLSCAATLTVPCGKLSQNFTGGFRKPLEILHIAVFMEFDQSIP